MLNKNKEKKIFLEGPVGKLEALVSGIDDSDFKRGVGIICHPHPLYQGTMNNKVVTTVIRTWQQLGVATVRFNFRGVGESEGNYDEGVGEVEDLQAVFEWVQVQDPSVKIWLAGFSFGAFVATRFAAQNPALTGLLTIAPALSLFDFVKLKTPTCPWLIIHGEQDELVSVTKVKDWYQLLVEDDQSKHIELVVLPQASHFFHGFLGELKIVIEEFWKSHHSLRS